MSSGSHKESPRTIRIDPAAINERNHARTLSGGSSHSPAIAVTGPRLSPTLTRSFDTGDADARERQRAMDVDSAMQLSRARSSSVSQGSPSLDGYHNSDQGPLSAGGVNGHGPQPRNSRQASDDSHSIPSRAHHFPLMSVAELEEMAIARGEYPPTIEESPEDPSTPDERLHEPSSRGDYLDHHHHVPDPDHLGVDMGLVDEMTAPSPRNEAPMHEADVAAVASMSMGGLPTYQRSAYPHTHARPSHFDYTAMDDYASQEKTRLGLISPGVPGQTSLASTSTGAELRRRLAQAQVESNGGFNLKVKTDDNPDQVGTPPSLENGNGAPNTLLDALASPPQGSGFSRRRQRKLSQSNAVPRRQGKLALFEGHAGSASGGGGPSSPALMPSSSSSAHFVSFAQQGQPNDIFHSPSLNPGRAAGVGSSPNFVSGGGGGKLVDGMMMPNGHGVPPPTHDRPYRFSFYSNAHSATIHARSLCELPAEGQSFEELFLGKKAGSSRHSRVATPATMESFGAAAVKAGMAHAPGAGNDWDPDKTTWWLDVTCPTEDEMRMLGKVFSIHPLTTEDILMEETREKIELFRHYYFVCFRSFDQDVYSPTHLEPLNMYIIVFREGTLSFHFRGTPHPQSVRRRIKQLKDYINVTSDWISYALIDDITDAFGPLIQNIEYEVDSIDELVLILKETEQSDMLRRIGTCRKKVMGLLRLMGNKADVVKGLAKRCNENWSVAPKSDIGLYLSDIQDHLITMTQNLNHYEKILSRSHSNYLAQISIEMTDANNQINDVLSKLTALGTVLVPMNLVTGLWGMNVHVPGQDGTTYTWFFSIIGALVGFAVVGGIATYKLLRSS